MPQLMPTSLRRHRPGDSQLAEPESTIRGFRLPTPEDVQGLVPNTRPALPNWDFRRCSAASGERVVV